MQLSHKLCQTVCWSRRGLLGLSAAYSRKQRLKHQDHWTSPKAFGSHCTKVYKRKKFYFKKSTDKGHSVKHTVWQRHPQHLRSRPSPGMVRGVGFGWVGKPTHTQSLCVHLCWGLPVNPACAWRFRSTHGSTSTTTHTCTMLKNSCTNNTLGDRVHFLTSVLPQWSSIADPSLSQLCVALCASCMHPTTPANPPPGVVLRSTLLHSSTLVGLACPPTCSLLTVTLLVGVVSLCTSLINVPALTRRGSRR